MSKVLEKIISIRNPKSPISESYRGIRTSIEFSNLDKEMKIINVTSSMQNEGKTTVIANLAVSFANLEKKVLLLEGDLRNPSVHRMFNISNINGLTDILLKDKAFAECVHCTDVKNLHVLTCGAMPPNPSEILSSKKMKEFITSLREYYDYIFIDCPPSLGMLTINSLTAVDSVLIPIQCEYYALEGVSQLMGTIKLVKSRLNPNLDIQGVVLSMFDGRANLSIQVVDEVKRYFKGSVYTTLIPRNVRLAEAPSHGKPVIYYDSKCKGAVAYMELAEEFIDLEEDII